MTVKSQYPTEQFHRFPKFHVLVSLGLFPSTDCGKRKLEI